jgi:hypothetical protein
VILLVFVVVAAAVVVRYKSYLSVFGDHVKFLAYLHSQYPKLYSSTTDNRPQPLLPRPWNDMASKESSQWISSIQESKLEKKLVKPIKSALLFCKLQQETRESLGYSLV